MRQFAAISILLSLTACVPLTPFERQDLLIKEIGEEDAQQRMTEVLKRSFNPGATEVKYEPNRMLVTLKLSGFQRGWLEIEHARLWKVDPYRNGRVFVWHTDRSFHHVNFKKKEDGVEFARLLYAFRTHYHGDKPPEPDPLPTRRRRDRDSDDHWND